MNKIATFLLLLFSAQLMAQVSIVKVVDWKLEPQQLTPAGNLLYFLASDQYDHEQIWKTDGTAAGTTMVYDLHDAGAWWVKNMTYVGGKLFFTVRTQGQGEELWVSNGTAAGTNMVLDIYPGSNGSAPEWLTAVGNTLFWVCDDGVHGQELWTSDGTALGTKLVLDIVPGSTDGNVANLISVNNILYFSAGNYVLHDYAGLYKSDGTLSGTELVKAIDGPILTFFNANGLLYFSYINLWDNNACWISDGTEGGTFEVWNGCNDIGRMANVGTNLFFKAHDCMNYPDASDEVCMVSPNFKGMVKDICPTNSSDPNYLVTMANQVFFSADDCTNGYELWRSDGTLDGTAMVKNIRPGNGSSSPLHLASSGGWVYFTADSDNGTGRELWRSDGSEFGTYMVKDIRQGAGSANPDLLTDVNGTLFFIAYDDQNGTQLWRTGGVSNLFEPSMSKGNIQIEPTLAHSYITVASANETDSEVLILDAVGNICMTAKSALNHPIYIDQLPPGIYYVRSNNGAIARFIKY